MKKFKNPKGAAMTWALIIVAVLVGVVAVLLNLFNGNIKTTVYQENQLRAYYYCRSGLDLGVEALIKEQTGPGGTVYTILDRINSYVIDEVGPEVISLDSVDSGEATVSAKRVFRNGKEWIEVLSIGKFMYQGEPVIYSGKVYVLASDPQVIEQEHGSSTLTTYTPPPH